MKLKSLQVLLFLMILISCNSEDKGGNTAEKEPKPILNLAEANRLASLPLACMQIEFPNKPNQTLEDSTHIATPKKLHPAFYGCFDWHSSVHGHWSLVSLLKQFPNLEHASKIREKLKTNLSEANIRAEVNYFHMKGNASFERTYGWAWILKLAEELHTWNDPLAGELENNLEPLTAYIVNSYKEFLPKLNYPIRVGEHTNTAFGLSLAWDYAETTQNESLKTVIKQTTDRFYKTDEACPLSWEPSGFDFLSPCLEEANLMRKVYPKDVYRKWLEKFMPRISKKNFLLEPGKVGDRADGKLVHLDGLNFSRAWCLYGIAKTLPEYAHLKNIANQHINHSLPSIVDDNYSGTHWLGTFALYALNHTKE